MATSILSTGKGFATTVQIGRMFGLSHTTIIKHCVEGDIAYHTTSGGHKRVSIQSAREFFRVQLNRALVKSICLNKSVKYKDENYKPRQNIKLFEHVETVIDLYSKGMTIADIVEYLWLSYRLATTYSGVFKLLHRVGLMDKCCIK